jgi:hypothetical protein
MNQTQVGIILQEINDEIKSGISKAVIDRLLNLVESLAFENTRLTDIVQQLNNEINRLKGEQGKPEFPEKKKLDGDISSEEERKQAEGRKPKGKNAPRNRKPKQSKIKIDRSDICSVDKKELPKDAVFKGYKDEVVQDIIIKTENVKYRREVYYSPSQKKYYYGQLPVEVKGKGEFGPGIRTLIPVLKSECNMSEPKIKNFLENFGVEISKSYISSLWTNKQDIFHREKEDIYRAGLESSSYQHIDDTSGKVNGENQHVQIVCNENYSAYFTTAKKDRLTIIDVLTNFAPRQFICNPKAFEDKVFFQKTLSSKSLLREMKLSEKIRVAVEKTLEVDKTYDEKQFNDLLEVIKPGPQQRTKILDACAIAAYHKQTDYPVINTVVSDDAPQFKLVTEKQALCWIHDGRHYKKLKPLVPKFQEKLETFRGQYWDYYAELYKYKENPHPVEAERLRLKFDQLFQTTTGYAQLDDRIKKTLSKKDELTLVLNQPEMPLHNNPAELAARCQTRNRDISLQTKSVAGTKAKDTFLTLTQTAKKLGVRVYDYIYDRVCGKNELPSLAELIRRKFQNPSSPSGP